MEKMAVKMIVKSDSRDKSYRRKLLDAIRAAAAITPVVGVDAARSQDFLYDDNGMPQ